MINNELDKILNAIPDPRGFDNTLASAIQCCAAGPDGFLMPDNVAHWLFHEATQEQGEILLSILRQGIQDAKKLAEDS
jgi:hypothetical protein